MNANNTNQENLNQQDNININNNIILQNANNEHNNQPNEDKIQNNQQPNVNDRSNANNDHNNGKEENNQNQVNQENKENEKANDTNSDSESDIDCKFEAKNLFNDDTSTLKTDDSVNSQKPEIKRDKVILDKDGIDKLYKHAKQFCHIIFGFNFSKFSSNINKDDEIKEESWRPHYFVKYYLLSKIKEEKLDYMILEYRLSKRYLTKLNAKQVYILQRMPFNELKMQRHNVEYKSDFNDWRKTALNEVRIVLIVLILNQKMIKLFELQNLALIMLREHPDNIWGFGQPDIDYIKEKFTESYYKKYFKKYKQYLGEYNEEERQYGNIQLDELKPEVFYNSIKIDFVECEFKLRSAGCVNIAITVSFECECNLCVKCIFDSLKEGICKYCGKHSKHLSNIDAELKEENEDEEEEL